MNMRYIVNLYKQYCNSRGIIFVPEMAFDFKNDFIDWIINNRKIGDRYADYLDNIGFYHPSDSSEIGKGEYDSLFKGVMPSISIYGTPKRELLIVEGYPIVDLKGELTYLGDHILLTHNPYDEMNICMWTDVHNKGLYNISIGMFGSRYDKDAKRKIDFLDSLAKRMNDDYKFNFDIENDNYFCSLNSDRYKKILCKKR